MKAHNKNKNPSPLKMYFVPTTPSGLTRDLLQAPSISDKKRKKKTYSTCAEYV